ncbi:MAG: hypothetical protein ABIG90_02845 [bacterium]
MNWKDIANQIISQGQVQAIGFWHSPWPQRLLLGTKIIFLLFSVFLIISIIIVTLQSRPFLEESWFMTFKGVDVPLLTPGKLRRKWQIIKKRLQSRDESNYKMAVVEADKILDNLLERAGYPGKSLGDRLKRLTPAQFSNLDALWQAHKLRNNIVHDIETEVKFHQAQEAVEAIQKALDELEAI